MVFAMGSAKIMPAYYSDYFNHSTLILNAFYNLGLVSKGDGFPPFETNAQRRAFALSLPSGVFNSWRIVEVFFGSFFSKKKNGLSFPSCANLLCNLQLF